jgi:hypothetical protein
MPSIEPIMLSSLAFTFVDRSLSLQVLFLPHVHIFQASLLNPLPLPSTFLLYVSFNHRPYTNILTGF